MPWTGKDADGYDRSGRRGDAYLAAREAGWSLKEIAAEFGVVTTAILNAIKRADKRHATRATVKNPLRRPGS